MLFLTSKDNIFAFKRHCSYICHTKAIFYTTTCLYKMMKKARYFCISKGFAVQAIILLLHFSVLSAPIKPSPEPGLALYERAMALISAHNQLGSVWAEDLENENQSLEYYLESLELSLEINDPASLSDLYNNIGISYKNLEMPDSAIVNYKRALHYGKISGQPRSILSPLINLGNIYQRKGDFNQALTYFIQADEMSDRISSRQKLKVWLSIGRLYNRTGAHSLALEYLTKGYELTASENDLVSYMGFLPDLAEAYGGQGKFMRAFKIQQKFITLNDSLNIRDKEVLIADLLNNYETAEKELAVLASQNLLKKEALELKSRSLVMVVILTLLIIITGISYTLYRQKKTAEKQASLQLKLSHEQARNKIQEDRLNISRESHGNIGSQLTFVNAGLEQFLYSETPPSTFQIRNLKENLAQSMRELKKTFWLISKTSASIDEISLRLRDAILPLQQNGLRIELVADGATEQKLNEIQTIHLYSIIQEAVNNAVKHSECQKITVRINAVKRGEITAVITDNGRGFDQRLIQKNDGLMNMKYRAEQIGGFLSLESQPGKGTTITLSFSSQ